MKLIILGTGNALVRECYNTCFALIDDNRTFLVDGGGGNQILSQLEKTNIKINSIHDVFVTHKHIDHILGIIWIIRLICQSMDKNAYDGEVTFYSHQEVIELLKNLSYSLLNEKETKYFDNRVHFVIVNNREKINIISHEVIFFDICSTKAKQYGFTLKINDNKKLTCCGDEPFNDGYYDLAINSTYLLHEAFCLYSEREKFHPYEKHHSTVKDACEIGQKLNCKNLILYHTEDKNINNRKELYVNEGKQYYSNNIFVPNDLEEFEL